MEINAKKLEPKNMTVTEFEAGLAFTLGSAALLAGIAYLVSVS